MSILFNPQEAITQKPCFRMPMFKELFFLYHDVDSPSLGLLCIFHSLCISEYKLKHEHFEMKCI
jgi:hypothetical protein